MKSKQWPEKLSFSAFKKFSPASDNWVCKTVYELRSDQISIQNQKIGLEKISKILRATFKLSASHGFASMSLRELSAESGISMGGLYSYIGSKEELANLIGHVLGVISNDLTDLALENANGTQQRLEAVICSHIFLSEQLQPWFYFVYMESKSLSTQQKQTAKTTELNFEMRISELIKQGIEEKLFHPTDVTLASSAIMALLQDWHLKRWKHHDRKITPDHYADFVLNLVMKLLNSGTS